MSSFKLKLFPHWSCVTGHPLVSQLGFTPTFHLSHYCSHYQFWNISTPWSPKQAQIFKHKSTELLLPSTNSFMRAFHPQFTKRGESRWPTRMKQKMKLQACFFALLSLNLRPRKVQGNVINYWIHTLLGCLLQPRWTCLTRKHSIPVSDQSQINSQHWESSK